jgi:hypothetical protein
LTPNARYNYIQDAQIQSLNGSVFVFSGDSLKYNKHRSARLGLAQINRFLPLGGLKGAVIMNNPTTAKENVSITAMDGGAF